MNERGTDYRCGCDQFQEANTKSARRGCGMPQKPFRIANGQATIQNEHLPNTTYSINIIVNNSTPTIFNYHVSSYSLTEAFKCISSSLNRCLNKHIKYLSWLI
jgi:hypothetical protein